MKLILNMRFVWIAILGGVMGLMTGCGDDDPVPAPDPTSIINNNQQEQPKPSELKVIEPSAIKEDTDEGVISVSLDELPGGRAVLTATAASQITIVGTYDNETGCYTFDISVLDGGAIYQYVISVYDKDGKTVMESKGRSITITESAVIDENGSEGGSDGTRGGTASVELCD